MDMQVERVRYRRDMCSIGAALDLVGEKWSLLILREAFMGLRRFDDILASVGCARSVLTARLATLVENDILKQVPYQDSGSRQRFEYMLTPKGHELFPILVALLQWGDKWNAPMKKPALILRHVDCKADVRAEVRCSAGHGPLQDHDTYARTASAAST